MPDAHLTDFMEFAIGNLPSTMSDPCFTIKSRVLYGFTKTLLPVPNLIRTFEYTKIFTRVAQFTEAVYKEKMCDLLSLERGELGGTLVALLRLRTMCNVFDGQGRGELKMCLKILVEQTGQSLTPDRRM